jgi:phosphoesterase RecJ-like protein
MIWNDLNEIIKNSRSFLISSHESQDGDNIGSQLAFFKFLKNLGKEVYIYNKEKTPQKFCFLPNSQEISDVAPNKKYDVLVILDSSNPQRCGIDQIETKFADKIVNIDHHRDNSMFGDVNCVDAKSAAACKILYDFFTQNDINIDCDMANCLLGGILTDTCGFQFNNDDGSLYLLADDLLKRGADNALLFKKLFSSGSIAALKVRAKIWETL